jgi:nucleoside 2-deoxyribosyltransferase
MIYLASPYSHPDPQQREQRYRHALHATAILMKTGEIVISPIVHSHHLHTEYGFGGDWETWAALDLALIDACSEVMVLQIAGWRMSKGVAAEIRYAKSIGRPVRYYDPETQFFREGGVVNEKNPTPPPTHPGGE